MPANPNILANLFAHHGCTPQIDETAYIHPSAQVIGEVILGKHSSLWCNAVVRGDVNHIHIGDDTNIQDCSVLHVSHKSQADPNGAPLIIGSRVTIGHSVILHGCTIQDECLVGMGSIIMDKTVLEPHVLVGAGSLVPEGKILRSGYLYLGRPVKEIRALTPEEIAYFNYSAEHYGKLAKSYKE